ncbi:MAG: YqgE/AlgH family protein [Rhodospirillaceae bacterium]|nr:YqgE/AlgH family protein [Rhodospirillaceae bacterium]
MRPLCLLLAVFLWSADALGAEKPSLAGRMLVAAEKLRDPYFEHAVVYLLEHDAEGAVGIIVNRKVGAGSLADLVADPNGYLNLNRHVDLYFGGPVAMTKLFVLHDGSYQGPGTVTSPGGIAMTGEKTIVEVIADGRGPRQHRFMTGYAGWGAGQLEGEISHGDWLDAPPDRALIFESTGTTEEIWRQALDKAGLTL